MYSHLPTMNIRIKSIEFNIRRVPIATSMRFQTEFCINHIHISFEVRNSILMFHSSVHREIHYWQNYCNYVIEFDCIYIHPPSPTHLQNYSN